MKKKIVQTKISSIIQFFMYFFICFPFIEFIHLGTDLQPYALLFSIIYVCYKNNLSNFLNYKINLIFLMFTILITILSFLYNAPANIIFRSCFHYLSICIIPIAVNISLKKDEINVEALFKFFMIIWAFVGLIQMLFNKSFLSEFVSNLRTSETRGVCSLASEPSFYGYMCYFFIIISMKFKKNKNFFILLNTIQILFLAQSSVSLIYILCLFILLILEKNISNFSLKSLLFSCGIIFLSFILFFIIVNYMNGTRIQDLLMKFMNDPKSLISDESVQQRIDAITVSINSFINSFGLPNGFGKTITNSGRIMSGYGSILHELGIIGAIIIIYIFNLISKSYNRAISISILITLFSAVQLGTPIFLFVFGYSIYEREMKSLLNKEDK